MKNIFVVFALFGLFMSCSNKDNEVEIEKIPHEDISDDIFLDYLLSNFDADSDGAISIEEAKAVKELDLSSIEGSLQSLKGIEYFTSLEKLTVKNQTQLDVPDLSKNVALTEFIWERSGDGAKVVDFSKNINLKTLYYNSDADVDLDISNNTALENLQLQYGATVTSFKNNTSLKNVLIAGWPHGRAIDFTDNTLLEDLYILMYTNASSHDYAETILNISNCKNLTNLYIAGVGIRSLTLQRANKLKDVFIENCDSLKSLDFSGATNLENFRLDGMEEIGINVSNCKNLRDLSSLTLLKKITTLNASGCIGLKTFSWNADVGSQRILKHLDLSDCTSLTEITCINSELEDLNLKGCTSLARLNCGGNSLTKLDMSTCMHLEELSCADNLLTEIDVSACKTLSALSCDNNQLKELDLSVCTGLVSLNCLENMLVELNLSGLLSLEVLVCQDNKLEELDVTDNIALKTILCLRNNLSILDLHTCHALETVNSNGNDNLQLLILYKNHQIKNLYYDDFTQIEYKE